MNIYEYLETLPDLDASILAATIIVEYASYLNCEGLTKHFKYYNDIALLDPGKAVEKLIYDIADLKSVESCGNKIDEHICYQQELYKDINEKFLPEEL